MEKLWTTAEVARHLGISETDVDRLVQDGKLTGYRLGGKFLRFKPDQVKQLKPFVEPRPPGSPVETLAPESWQARLRDFLYFYDFYLLSVALLAGVAFYLVLVA